MLAVLLQGHFFTVCCHVSLKSVREQKPKLDKETKSRQELFKSNFNFSMADVFFVIIFASVWENLKGKNVLYW